MPFIRLFCKRDNTNFTSKYEFYHIFLNLKDIDETESLSSEFSISKPNEKEECKIFEKEDFKIQVKRELSPNPNVQKQITDIDIVKELNTPVKTKKKRKRQQKRVLMDQQDNNIYRM